MSLYILASGALIADPVRRVGSKGDFATATVRAATEDGAVLVSAIAFNQQAELLLSHRQGDAISVSGRGKLTAWTGRDGEEHRGLSLVIEQLAAAARRADGARRREARNAA